VTDRKFYVLLSLAVFASFAMAAGLNQATGYCNGSMADWVAAIATVAAFVAAVIAARYAAGALDLERGREEQRLQAERRAQASLVAAWPAKFIPHQELQNNDTWLTVEGIAGAAAMIRNASDVPVTGVHVDFWVVHGEETSHQEADIRFLGGVDVKVLPPVTEPQEIQWLAGPNGHMVPGVPTTGHHEDYWPDHPPYDPSRLVVDIIFRDAAGTLWRRDRLGRLEEIAVA
jgi:hypothetical protein